MYFCSMKSNSKITKELYNRANIRLEELINVVNNNTPLDSPLAKEFLKVSNIIEEYESIHYPMVDPK
ncbi:XRE family transcriptional regulator [Zobellia roscoffensis]